MVGVEHGDEVAGGMLKPVIEVAGLGVRVLRPRQVVHAELRAKPLQVGAAALGGERGARVGAVDLLVGAAVVEQPHGQLVGRVVHADRRSERGGEQPLVLVVGRHEDVDGRKLIVRQLPRARPLQRVDDDEQADEQHQHREHLHRVEDEARHEIDRLVDGRQRRSGAPVDVADDDCGSERQEDLPPDALLADEPGHGHHHNGCDARHELCLDADRLADQQHRNERRRDPQRRKGNVTRHNGQYSP